MSDSPSYSTSFTFEPSQIKVKAGDTVAVDVLMYSESEPVVSADVWISYNPEILSLTKAENVEFAAGGLFSKIDAKQITAGKLYLYAINPNTNVKNAVNGKIATLYFKAGSNGQTDLRFMCDQSQRQTSAIIRNDTELTNITNCDRMLRHVSKITVTGSESVLGASTSNPSEIQWGFLGAFIFFTLMFAVLYRHYKSLGYKP